MVSGLGKVNIDLIFSGLKRLPEIGEEVYSEGFKICLGGGAPATLINLSRLNVPVRLLTYLNKDLFSDFATSELNKLKVEYYNLYCGKGIPYNVTTAMLTQDNRTFVSYGEQGYAPVEKIYPLIKDSRYLIMQPGYKELYAKLKEQGIKLILDSGWEDDLSIENYKEYLILADYYLPNRQEALKITGKKDIREAAKVLSEFFEEVIIKLDAEGTYVYKKGEGELVPAFKQFKHKDSTGAGDAFLAGFIYGLYHGYDIKKCALAGNATGGKCVTEIGCLSAYLNEEELLALIK